MAQGSLQLSHNKMGTGNVYMSSLDLKSSSRISITRTTKMRIHDLPFFHVFELFSFPALKMILDELVLSKKFYNLRMQTIRKILFSNVYLEV